MDLTQPANSTGIDTGWTAPAGTGAKSALSNYVAFDFGALSTVLDAALPGASAALTALSAQLAALNSCQQAELTAHLSFKLPQS